MLQNRGYLPAAELASDPNELSYILNDATPCTLIHDHVFADTAPDLASACNIGLVLEVREPGEDSTYEQALETNERLHACRNHP